MNQGETREENEKSQKEHISYTQYLMDPHRGETKKWS